MRFIFTLYYIVCQHFLFHQYFLLVTLMCHWNIPVPSFWTTEERAVYCSASCALASFVWLCIQLKQTNVIINAELAYLSLGLLLPLSRSGVKRKQMVSQIKRWNLVCRRNEGHGLGHQATVCKGPLCCSCPVRQRSPYLPKAWSTPNCLSQGVWWGSILQV